MRPLLVVLLLASTGHADPAAKPRPLRVEAVPPARVTPTDRVPGVRGHDVTGRILVPAPHPDARPHPLGAVIDPPDVRDDNVLVPGTLQLGLPGRADRGPIAKQLIDRLQAGVGAFVNLLVPRRS